MNELQKLILDRLGDRSFVRLSRDCGGIPTERSLSRLKVGPLTSFPERDTIEGLARGLGVSVTRVVMVCAASIGLRVQAGDDTELVLPGAGALPPDAQEALMSVSRAMLNAHATPRPGTGTHSRTPPV